MSNSLRHANTINISSNRTEAIKNYFCLFIINEWKKINPEIRNPCSKGVFCNALLKFISPAARKT